MDRHLGFRICRRGNFHGWRVVRPATGEAIMSAGLFWGLVIAILIASIYGGFR
jgi:hypothetical protein